MSTYVRVGTRVHTVTFVTQKIMYTLKEIVRLVGLDPTKLSREWAVIERGVSTWLRTGHLERVTLEIRTPDGARLAGRWDLDIDYDLPGDGTMWADAQEVRYNILKAGHVPSTCEYSIWASAPGGPSVAGWGSGQMLSKSGFRRYSLGTTIDGNGIGVRASYWRKS